MHPNQRYKICICSVILGELKCQCYFPENFGCNLALYESEIFFDTSLHHIFESNHFRFSFPYEKQPNLGYEMWKIKLVGNLFIREASEIVHEWNGHTQIFSCPQVIENSICFSEQIFYRKQSSGAPDVSLSSLCRA